MNTVTNRSKRVLRIAYSAALMTLAFTSFPLAAQEVATQELPLDLDALSSDVSEKKPAKVNRLDAEKWEKRNYARIYARRKQVGLPADLSLAAVSELEGDPMLAAADITSTIEQPEASAYIRGMFDSFAAFFPHTKLPDVNILFNDADVASAKAVATGQMVFNAGILEKIDTQDALLFVLAHEMAHIAYDHFKKEENRKTANDVATLAILFAKRGNEQAARQSDELAGYMFFSEKLWGPQWSRGDETVADELAIDLLVRGKHSLNGAQSILTVLEAEDARRKDEYEARCGKPAGGAGGLGRFGRSLLVGLSHNETLVAPGCETADTWMNDAMSWLSRTHLSPAQRHKKINEYVKTRYPNYGVISTTAIPDGVRAVIASADSPLQRSLYASRAIDALQEGQLALATKYALASLREEDKVTPKPRLAMYMLLLRAGRHDEAVKHLEIAIAGGHAAKGIYLIALQERMATAAQVQSKGEADRVAAELSAITRQYQGKPDKALADAKAQSESVSQTATAAPIPPLSPDAVKAYESALALAVAGKEKFTENQEFEEQGSEIRRILHPDGV